jgi:hypothetical protein
MLFRNSIVPEGTVFNVRFYHAGEDGRSDADTAFYATIPASKFDAEPAFGGTGRGFWYKLNVDHGIAMLGDWWWCGYGYTEAAENQQAMEVARLEKQLEKVMTVRDFS